MRRLVSTGVLVLISLVGGCVSSFAEHATRENYRSDPRLARLKSFFDGNKCPIGAVAEEFLVVADLYLLDWRLLPSIALIETGGGRTTANNNLFGWDSGRKAFATMREAIHTVALKLATSKLYRDKDVRGILQTYNADPLYPARVQTVMERLSPAK